MKKNDIRSVIIGVDFSKYSKTVCEQGRAIAKKLNAPVIFVHVFQDLGLNAWGPSVTKASLANHYQKETKRRYKVKDEETLIVACGKAFEEIISIAKKFSKPLIVVGHRGDRSLVSRFFIGSTAERLALHSPFPVWVHRGQKIHLPKSILVPCDFSARSRNAIEGAKKVALDGTQLELYHVFQPLITPLNYETWKLLDEERTVENLKALKKFRKKYAPLKVVQIKSPDVIGEIGRRSKAFDAIAISPREHKGLFPSFGSVTSQVVRSGETPVLVIP